MINKTFSVIKLRFPCFSLVLSFGTVGQEFKDEEWLKNGNLFGSSNFLVICTEKQKIRGNIKEERKGKREKQNDK